MIETLVLSLMACFHDASRFSKLPERTKNQLVAIHLMRLDKIRTTSKEQNPLEKKQLPKKALYIHEYKIVLGSKFMLVRDK